MNAFDEAILSALNSWAQYSWTFDQLMVLVVNTELLKGGVVVALLWWLWFSPPQGIVVESRQRIIATILGVFAALVAASILAIALPFRARPAENLRLAFIVPHGWVARTAHGWSAFPSDHAALFLGLTTGYFLIQSWLGWCVLAYVIVVILLPRIYLGLHYPTDIIGGGVLGVVSVILLNGGALRRIVVGNRLSRWVAEYPGAFYAVFFLLTYQIATLFWDLRVIGTFIRGTLPGLIMRWR